MKFFLILLVMLLCYSSVKATGVIIAVINHSDQKLTSIGWELGNDVPPQPSTYPDSVGKNQTTRFQTAYYSSRGVEGSLILYTKDGLCSIRINFDNPYVGKSSYSAYPTGPYRAKVLVDRSVEPEFISVEITGGEPSVSKPNTLKKSSNKVINVAPPAVTNISSLGNNIIDGTITWNEEEAGNPTTTDWANIFQFNCKVPLKFVPDNFSNDVYKGRKGEFEGEQKTGQLLFRRYSVQGHVHTLEFTFDHIADEVPLIVFDVQVNQKVSWQAPSNSPSPAATGYHYVVVTDMVQNPVQSGNLYTVSLSLFGGWTNDKTDNNSNTQKSGIADKIALQKKRVALPAQAFATKRFLKLNR